MVNLAICFHKYGPTEHLIHAFGTHQRIDGAVVNYEYGDNGGAEGVKFACMIRVEFF